MTIDDLLAAFKSGFRARFDAPGPLNPQGDEAIRAGIYAVVTALKDELCEVASHIKCLGGMDALDVAIEFNRILASDGEEADGGSTREDERPSNGVLVRSNTADGLKAPSADLLFVDEAGKFTEEQWKYLHSSAATVEDLAIFGMAVSRIDGDGNVTRINPADMYREPVRSKTSPDSGATRDARTVIAKAIRDNTRIENSLGLSDMILEALERAGLVIVPRVPSEKMWAAHDDTWVYEGTGHDQRMREWEAMLDAANE